MISTIHNRTHKYTFNLTRELVGMMQPFLFGMSLYKMKAIARESCLISPHSVHTWSQSGVDQSESIIEFYDSVTHTPPTLPSAVQAWVKTNAEWSNADSRFSTPSQLHTLNLSWCQDLRRWRPLMTPVRENNRQHFVVHGGRFHLLKALPSTTSREITHSVINYLFSGSLAVIHVHRELAILIPNKCALSGLCHCQHAGLSWVQVRGQ